MHHHHEHKVKELVGKLQQTFGEELVSVCVYGSSLLPEAEPAPAAKNGQDVNVLVILKQLDGRALAQAGDLALWWEKTAHTLPIFMSETEWRQSADIFALEYADIRDHHEVAYGADLYSDVEVHRDALRLVCELELNRKLLLLRQQMMVSHGKPQHLQELLQQSIGSFTTLFRAILRLELPRQEIPHRPGEVLERLPAIIDGFDPKPFQRILASKHQRQGLPKAEIVTVCHQYLAQIDRVNHYVNQHFAPSFQEAPV